MGRFVNPFTDIGFKVIIGSELSKDVLIQLLNALLEGEHHIEDLVFLDKEDHSDNIHDRGIVYDIYCRTSDLEYIIVEMQNAWHSNFLDRTLYYVCRSISRQPKQIWEKMDRMEAASGQSFKIRDEAAGCSYGKRYRLSTVYGIFLMNFNESGLGKKFRTDTAIMDCETGKVVNPHFRQIYLQFPYFTKELDECTTLCDKLMYTLKNMDKWERMPGALKEQVFKRLAQLAEVANLSEADRIAYDKAVDAYYINETFEADCYERGMKRGWEKGQKEGLELGKKEGLELGKKEGLEEGIKEGKRKVALRMKKQGLSDEEIVEFTDLSLDEVRTL